MFRPSCENKARAGSCNKGELVSRGGGNFPVNWLGLWSCFLSVRWAQDEQDESLITLYGEPVHGEAIQASPVIAQQLAAIAHR